MIKALNDKMGELLDAIAVTRDDLQLDAYPGWRTRCARSNAR